MIFRSIAFTALATLALCVQAGDKPAGQAVYLKHCAACHDDGVARAPTPETLSKMEPVAVVRALETGVMRMVGNFTLSGAERVAVAEFVTGKTYAADLQHKTVNQCGASPPWPNGPDVLAKPHWNSWGANPQNTRFQPAAMAGIDRAGVAKLELQWAFAFPGETLAEAHSSVVDGRLFVGSRSGEVYALDAKTGCTYWTFHANAAVKGPMLVGSVPGSAAPYLFFGDLSGRAYAVDGASGQQVWVRVADEHPTARLTGGFQLVDGTLYVPVSSLEEGAAADPNYKCCTFRGSLMALDAATGAVRWKKYVIDQAATLEHKTADGRITVGPSGGAVWSAPTIDAKLGRLYVATGDNYSQPATLTSDALLGLSMQDGAQAWAYQGLPGDAWNAACSLPNKANCPEEAGPDHDMGSSAILIEMADGKRALLAGQKTGVMHALDPDDNGKVLWKTRVAKGGILGGIEWGSASDGKAVYVAVSDARWEKGEFFGAKVTIDPTKGGGLFALNVNDGKVIWQAPPVSCVGRERCSPAQTAAVTVIPGVVFSGSMSGVMRAFDSDTGKVIWEYDTVRDYQAVNGALARGGAIDQSGVVVVDGWVYMNSGYANWGALPGNVLLAFKAKP